MDRLSQLGVYAPAFVGIAVLLYFWISIALIKRRSNGRHKSEDRA